MLNYAVYGDIGQGERERERGESEKSHKCDASVGYSRDSSPIERTVSSKALSAIFEFR